MTTKVCNKCKEAKPLSEFWKDKSKSDGFYGRCKSCYNARHRDRRATEPKYRQKKLASCKKWDRENPRDRRDENIYRNYKLKRGQYEEMLVSQGGLCAICGQKETEAGRTTLSVDHDHKTGVIRGLLCGVCNRGLGFFRDDPVRLAGAIRYLQAQVCRVKADVCETTAA